jgi:hypothetical protein
MKQEDAAGGGSHTRAHACDFADDSIATGFRIYFSNVKKKPHGSQDGTPKKKRPERPFFWGSQRLGLTATATGRRTTSSAATAAGGLGVHEAECATVVTIFEFNMHAIQGAQTLRIHENI